MTIFNKEMIDKVTAKMSCGHKATGIGVDGEYTLTYHQHEDGALIINSWVTPVTPLPKKLQAVPFFMTSRAHDQ